MNELMELLNKNLICTDIEIQLTLERTTFRLQKTLYGYFLSNKGVDSMKRLLLAIVILIGLNVYSDDVTTYINTKVDAFMNEAVFSGLEFRLYFF